MKFSNHHLKQILPFPALASACRAFFLVVFALCLSISSSFAQDIKASISPSVIAIGQTATYTIQIEADTAGLTLSPFALELPKGLESVAAQRGIRQVTENGQPYTEISLQFQIMAEETGKFTIPPQTVRFPNQTKLTTTPVNLEVRESVDEPAQPVGEFDPIVNLTLEKTECFVGEAVPMEIQLLTHHKTDLLQIGALDVKRDNFAVKRFPLRADTSFEQVGDELYEVRISRSSLSGLKPGEFEFGPASMEMRIRYPFVSRQGGFLSPFEMRIVKATSGTVPIKVKPLPEKGKPADFQGAVGEFSLYIRAEPKEVRTGDPITVTCVVRGKGNFDYVEMAKPLSTDGWKIYPPKKLEGPVNDEAPPPEFVQWTQVFVPEKNQTEIPAFQINFFNPNKEIYETLSSEPIPIVVTGEPMVASPPAVGTNTAETTPPESTPPPADGVKAPQDILGVLPLPGALALTPAPLFQQPFFWMAQAVPLLILLSFLVTYWQQRRAAAPAKAAAPQQSLRQLEKISGADLFYTLAARLILARYPEARADDPSLASGLREPLARYETIRFQPSHSEQSIDPSEKRKVLETLRQLLS
jgi:hypothetical protein